MTPSRVAIRFLALTMLVSAAWPAESLGQSPSPTEYQVKAAYLYNFVKFVEWPATAEPLTGPIGLCVLGKDPFEGELERATSGKTVNGRPLSVRRPSDASAALSCQVVFISPSEAGRATEITKKLAGSSILTISDMDRFCERGGMIQFLMEGHRVRFRINQMTAEHASLKISSKLLQLAVASDDKK